MYGQEEIDKLADKRGVVPPNLAAGVRDMRAQEWWQRYDSVIIGPGARDRSRGWYNSWADFANASTIKWFGGREGAGLEWTNQERERTDWAQDLLFTNVEFVVPTGPGDLYTEPNDAEVMKYLFTGDIANQLTLTTVLAESDEISKAPAIHYPAGWGNAYPALGSVSSPTVLPGPSGEPNINNAWKWPEAIMLAAKATLQVNGIVGSPIRDILGSLPGPGFRRIPTAGGSFVDLPCWYAIRITFSGPRYLQLRGARTAA